MPQNEEVDVAPGRDFSDAKVRNMLSKAGFDVTLNDDVASFARFVRAMFAEYESTQRASDTRRTVIIALISSLIPVFVTVALHYLKVI